MEKKLENIESWIAKNCDQIFRFTVYKKMFTPYEEEQKFSDESVFEDDYASFCYIKGAVELPDHRIFLELDIVDPEADFKSLRKEFYMWDEIRLSYFYEDNMLEEDFEYED